MKNVEHSTNASPVEFAWDFQHNAGIFIMLQNIERANAVRIEGPSEDIEITLENSKKIYAQAKSVTRIDDYSNVIANLRKALGTLDKAWESGDGECLIYTTNSPNPFNSQRTMMQFYGSNVQLYYHQLTEDCRKKIDKYYVEGKLKFPKEKLSVLVVAFSGNDERTRYHNIEDFVGKFLEGLGLRGEYFWSEKAMIRWQQMFGRNASKTDQHIKISKKEMMWPLIVWLCEDWKSSARLEDYDVADRAALVRRYKVVIDDVGENFRFVTHVLRTYDDYRIKTADRIKTSAERTKIFLSEKWDNFKNYFDLQGVDAEIGKAVVTLAVEQVLNRRRQIAHIKEIVHL